MTKRKDPLSVANKDQALDCMLGLADQATVLAQLMADREAAIAKVNEEYADQLDVHTKHCLALKTALTAWAQENEGTEADKNTRTITFPGVGTIQLRTGNPTVCLKRGLTEEDVINAFWDEARGQYVRTVQVLNREAILTARADETEAQVIKNAGVVIRQSEGALFEIDGIGKI